MTEILCAKTSNSIYISRMHAILAVLQGLYRMPCELNHFIFKSQHSCGWVTLLATLRERTDMHQKALLLSYPSEALLVIFGESFRHCAALYFLLNKILLHIWGLSY